MTYSTRILPTLGGGWVRLGDNSVVIICMALFLNKYGRISKQKVKMKIRDEQTSREKKKKKKKIDYMY